MQVSGMLMMIQLGQRIKDPYVCAGTQAECKVLCVYSWNIMSTHSFPMPIHFYQHSHLSSKNHSIFQEWKNLPEKMLSVIVIYLHGQYVSLALGDLIIVTCLKV